MNNFLESSEVKNVIFKNKKFIILAALIFGLLLGGYKGFSVMTATEKKVDDNALTYEEKLKSYNDQKEGYEKTINVLEQELASANTIVLENPIMKINPYDCEFSTVMVALGDGNGSIVKTVYGWINAADAAEVFDSNDEILNKYRSSIVSVNQGNYIGEVEIQVYNTESCDAKKVAKNVESLIRKNAEKSGQAVRNITVFHQRTHCALLFDSQGYFRNNVTRVNSEIKSVKEVSRTLEMPAKDKTISTKSKLISIAKFTLLGLVLGLIMGVIMILYKITKGGYLLSGGQVETLFEIESIGDYSPADKENSRVIGENINVLSSNVENIMLLNKYAGSDDKHFIEDMSELCGKSIIQGKNVISDVETVSALKAVDGVIIGIVPGKTRFDEVHRSIVRLNKLGKNLIGFVVFK